MKSFFFVGLLSFSMSAFSMTEDEINACYAQYPSLNNVSDAIYGMSEWGLSEDSATEIKNAVEEALKAGANAKTCDSVLAANVLLAHVGHFNLSLETVSSDNQVAKERYLNDFKSFICVYANLVPDFENNYSCN
jgi:hypothetical protein